MLAVPEKSVGSTLMLKAHMKTFPSSSVTRIHTKGASRALWIMAEKRYLRSDKKNSYIIFLSHFPNKTNTFDSLYHGRIFGSVPEGPHPLVHHDARVSIDQNPQEEKYDRRDDHHSQGVEFVVLRETRAVEVKAGVELDADESQDDADPIGDGLGVGLEVLQN